MVAHRLLRRQPALPSETELTELEAGSLRESVYQDGIHDELLHSLVRSGHPDQSEISDDLLIKCWQWFCRHLDSSIRNDWEQVLQGVIKDLDPCYPQQATDWPPQACKVYKVLTRVTDAIRTRGDVSIDGIVRELVSGNVLLAGEQDGLHGTVPDHDGAKLVMVWCLVGMITMLYDPEPRLHRRELHLRLPALGRRPRGISRPGEITCTQQNLERCRDPIHALLAQFGEVMPKVEADQEYLDSVDVDHINIAHINFHTLKNVAKLEIEWVSTLNLHLQLDKRRKILRLFRFPSFCRLAWSETGDSFMNQLFTDHRRSQVHADMDPEHSYSDYLREVMLSYRLLFGIDGKSRRSFKAELADWRKSLPCDIRLQDPGYMDDPLLILLCTTTTPEPRRAAIHSDPLSELLRSLHGEEKSEMYDLEDFPFLGRRLADIQRFSLKQKPNDWISVFLTDRRDPQSYWNNMIATTLLVIGGLTILLSLLQLIFQIWGTFR